MKKIVVSKSGVAKFVGHAIVPEDEHTQWDQAAIKVMLADLDGVTKRAGASSYETLPIHLLQSTMNSIYWKNMATWPGSKQEFNRVFMKTFKGPMTALEVAGRKPDLVGGFGDELRELQHDLAERQKQKQERPASPQTLKRFNDLTLPARIRALNGRRVRLVFNNGKLDMRGRLTLPSDAGDSLTVTSPHSRVSVPVSGVTGAEHRDGMYVLTYDAGTINSDIAAQVDAVINEANDMERISRVNQGIDHLMAALANTDYAMIKVSDQDPVEVFNPRVKKDIELSRFVLYSERGAGTPIPIWVLNLTEEPIEDVAGSRGGEWVIRTGRQLVVIAPLEKKPEPVAAYVGQSIDDKLFPNADNEEF